MLKKSSLIFGIVLTVLGILGYVPGVTSDGVMIGLFNVNSLFNILLIVSGLVGIYTGSTSAKASKTYFQVFGVIFAIWAILAFITTDMIFGQIANNMADAWLFTVAAVIALYYGFGVEATEEA